MKRQIKFEETDSAYCFKCDKANGATASFSVKKPSLEFDIKKFYEAFFKGDDRYDGLEFPDIEESWSVERHFAIAPIGQII